MITRRSLLGALCVTPLLAVPFTGCSTLGVFDTLVPKDGGARLVGGNLTYGPESRQRLDVYAPDDNIRPSGILVFVYGGSWSSGSKDDYGFVGRAFAARGYVTIIFDYRLVPEVRYPAFVEDSAKAVAWAYRNAGRYGSDLQRLYLMGHSAGAYNAAMVALAPEFLRAEGLSPTVIRAFAGLSGPYDFLPLDVEASRAAFAGVEKLGATQPVNRVSRGSFAPPMLLVTGDADDTVLPRNTKNLAAVLRDTGHRVEEIYYPGVDHAGTLLAIARPLRGRAPVVDDIVRFFSEH